MKHAAGRGLVATTGAIPADCYVHSDCTQTKHMEQSRGCGSDKQEIHKRSSLSFLTSCWTRHIPDIRRPPTAGEFAWAYCNRVGACPQRRPPPRSHQQPRRCRCCRPSDYRGKRKGKGVLGLGPNGCRGVRPYLQSQAPPEAFTAGPRPPAPP
jgi:hypothetical protein